METTPRPQPTKKHYAWATLPDVDYTGAPETSWQRERRRAANLAGAADLAAYLAECKMQVPAEYHARLDRLVAHFLGLAPTIPAVALHVMGRWAGQQDHYAESVTAAACVRQWE